MNTKHKNLTKKIPAVFMGTSDFAVPVLECIINNEYLNLKAVITQPDKEVGRKKIITPSPVKVYSQKANLTVLQPKKIKDPNFIIKLKDINPGLIVVAAYGQILPQEIIEMPKYGCINIHASLLPKYRGASPIQTAILNGDEETGVTIMKMDMGLDTGDIISREKVKIKNSDTAQDLQNELSKLGAKLFMQTLPDYLDGKIKPFEQDDSKATITKLLTKRDGEINFKENAKDIERKLRAFTYWPGIYILLNNNSSGGDAEATSSVKRGILKPFPLRVSVDAPKRKLKILKLKLLEDQINPLVPVGQFYQSENKLVVNCGNGALILATLQLEGKQKISGQDFINGYLK